MKRSAFLVLALVGAATVALGGDASLSPDAARAARERIKALKKELGRTGNPDSLKYRLAVAYREAETIEDRYRALELLDAIRPVYDADPEFHREWARTYEASARYLDARTELERVVALRPSHVEARVQIARLLIKELLYTFELSYAESIREWLGQALELEPGHRDALFLLSLTLHLARDLPYEDPLPLSYEGKRCAEHILQMNPADIDARFLLAIHHLDLGEVNQADREFKTCVNEAPPEAQRALMSCDRTGDTRLVHYAHTLDPERQRAFGLAYWRRRDPTPLTVANENQLEFWKRMALAEFLFGDPEGDRYGWETDPGTALVRYGKPAAQTFDPGSVTGDSYGRDRFKPTLDFQPPSLNWVYHFRDMSFTLKFEDRSLQGAFFADDSSAATLVALERVAPVVFREASPGAIENLYLTSAGVLLGPDGTVRQSLYVGLPPWRTMEDTDWLADSRIEVQVRDSTYTKVSTNMQRIRADNVYRPFPGTEIVLYSQKVDLKPGRYSVTSFIEDKDSGLHGSFTLPLVVRDYVSRPALQVSDLELALAFAPHMEGPRITKLGREYLPNPMGLVGDDRNLDVFYELYHLTPLEGTVSYLSRYTILPLDYVVGFDHHVTRGAAAREDLTVFAAGGLAIGNVTLSTRNYSDIRFPRETVPARGDRMPKGARVDVSGLDPGRYVLVVTVTDAVSQAEATAQTPFQILTDGALRELLTYRLPEASDR